jgi:hypothetical protein
VTNFRLAIKEPSAEEKAYLENSINRFNIHLTGIPFNGNTAVLAYDEQDRIIGGANGFQWGDSFTIEFLWLEEQWRGQDIGTQINVAAHSSIWIPTAFRLSIFTKSLVTKW